MLKPSVLAVAASLSVLAFSAVCDRDTSPEALAARVIEDRGADAAAAALRELGPHGLEVLIAARDRAVLDRDERARVDAAIDRVAAQRYASVSHLYWFTDLELAKAEAVRTKRPILSLRMLGRLTDEL